MKSQNFSHLLALFTLFATVLICDCELNELKPTKVIIEADRSQISNLKTHHGDDVSIFIHRNGQEALNEGTTESPANDFQNNTTKTCVGNDCCYQYTWPGYLEPERLPTPQNATCEAMKSSSRNPGMACFNPLVYSTKDNRPNLTALIDYCDRHGCGIYCSKSGNANTCIKYTYYTNQGVSSQVNETRFCGSVTDAGSGNRINNGCFTDKRGGYIRTVCVCDTDRCNGSFRLNLSFMLVFQIFVVLIKILF